MSNMVFRNAVCATIAPTGRQTELPSPGKNLSKSFSEDMEELVKTLRDDLMDSLQQSSNEIVKPK